MIMLLMGQAEDIITKLLPGVEQGSIVWLTALVLISSWPLLAGFLLDMAVGDPHWLPHPIRLIGWSIKSMEKLLRPKKAANNVLLFRRGVALAVLIPLLTALMTAGLLLLAWKLHFTIGLLMETVFCWLVLAARSLKTETTPVQDALVRGDMAAARERIGWLVGRDTAELDSEEITKAAVETIAENTNDGVIAPLFYLVLGGPILGMTYKAVNTLDSMVGYKNDLYLYFGRCSARLDDITGFIPARLSALLMILAAKLLHLPADRAWQIFRRDRLNHLSPNSAQTEAVCAGALGIQLGGSHTYGGKLVVKPFIGDKIRSAEPQDIARSQQLMLLTSILALITLWPLSMLLQLILANLSGCI